MEGKPTAEEVASKTAQQGPEAAEVSPGKIMNVITWTEAVAWEFSESRHQDFGWSIRWPGRHSRLHDMSPRMGLQPSYSLTSQ
jgi:hypothetical protein